MDNLIKTALVGASLARIEHGEEGWIFYFDNASLTAYNHVIFTPAGLEANGQRVQKVEQSDDCLTVTLQSGESFKIDLRDEAYSGPEALQIRTADGKIIIV